ncbi:hypothetical protein [Streptomyces fodineus]|uniref:hypothetical protein n=1 Tax=Streptomyces fodineus TaxID=1904616 RepID=UPI000AE7C7E9|nr:hypothetical protein [Streptomyces fodineus]
MDLTSWHNALVQPLPVPCPAHLIPDATGTDAFHDAYRNAMAHNAVFVAIEFERRQRWTVKADTLTAGSGHTVPDAVNDAVRAAIIHLVHSNEVDLDAYTGPVYFMMHGVRSEETSPRTRRRTPRRPLRRPGPPGPRRPSRTLTGICR